MSWRSFERAKGFIDRYGERAGWTRTGEGVGNCGEKKKSVFVGRMMLDDIAKGRLSFFSLDVSGEGPRLLSPPPTGVAASRGLNVQQTRRLPRYVPNSHDMNPPHPLKKRKERDALFQSPLP